MDSSIIDIIEHIDFLKKIVLKLEAELVLELGVRSGNSTKAFLDGLRITGGRLISVDIEDCSHVVDSDSWTFHRCDSLDLDVTNIYPDITFIDTSHTFEQTLSELKKFSPITKKLIILHDTISCPDVMDAINEYCRISSGWSCVENFENNNGLGLIWK